MKSVFFSYPSDFRKWLQENSLTETELLVGYYKVGTKKPSMTWPESVDEALCFGWIDGVRRSIDEESYSIRFTPRKSSSIWSAINIKKVEELTSKGLMMPEGLTAFSKRTEEKSRIYSHEKEAGNFSTEFEEQFKARQKAWDFFNTQAPSYKKVMIHLVMTAKQEATRIKRLTKLIEASESGKRVL